MIKALLLVATLLVVSTPKEEYSCKLIIGSVEPSIKPGKCMYNMYLAGDKDKKIVSTITTNCNQYLEGDTLMVYGIGPSPCK
jgi:hypothetical protein